MPRLVIVEPAYASTVGHHGEVNRSLLAALGAAGWSCELWTDLALEGEPGRPRAVRGVFSGCGYEDPRLWSELGGMVQLGRRMEQQLELASAGGEPVAAWLGHSLLPFQLLGLARHLATAPPARVLLSLMFAPGETLGGPATPDQARANCRVALAALAKATAQGGHALQLAFPSRQQERLYGPLLAATGLASAGVHPAVVGAGCQPEPPPPASAPLVLLHWGDLKAGKGRESALAVLQALLEQGIPAPLHGWGWLFHSHSHTSLSPTEGQILERAEAAGLGLDWRRGAVSSQAMVDGLAHCPVALLAYDPVRYAERSSGILWQWAASRQALGQAAAGVGYATGWLAQEAQELGLAWHVPSGSDGPAWLAALAEAAQRPRLPAPTPSAYGQSIWKTRFADWCLGTLRQPA